MANKAKLGRWARWWGAGLVGLAGMAVSLSASAAVVSGASITGLTFTLIDLAPTDGIAPTLTWTAPFSVVEANRSFDQVVNFSPFPSGGLQWSVTFAQSDPTSTSDDALTLLAPLSASQTGASALIDSLGLSAQATASHGEQQTSFAYSTGSFQLSANTELRVTATISSSTSGPGGAGFQNPAGAAAGFGGLIAQGLGYAELFLGDASTLSLSEGLSHGPSTDPFTYIADAFSESDTQLVEMTLRNDSTDDYFGAFYGLVQASAMEVAPFDAVSTVPVPATLYLVLLALGAGAAIRRR